MGKESGVLNLVFWGSGSGDLLQKVIACGIGGASLIWSACVWKALGEVVISDVLAQWLLWVALKECILTLLGRFTEEELSRIENKRWTMIMTSEERWICCIGG
ncbi:unnamed protein product [Ilex paraguariensis]|uniref:Uncharacterized protein n=1 Tax=Ilex paraguariensis TaxID=185542 RepID=A0ABC8RI94_9AQUA